MDNKYTFATDFDGTITIDNKQCYPGLGFRYPGDPNWEVIDSIRALSNAGHYILIYSVRCNWLITKEDSTRFIYFDMIDWLHRHNIPYDSVYNGVGKPAVDWFIDDRNITPEQLAEFVKRII